MENHDSYNHSSMIEECNRLRSSIDKLKVQVRDLAHERNGLQDKLDNLRQEKVWAETSRDAAVFREGLATTERDELLGLLRRVANGSFVMLARMHPGLGHDIREALKDDIPPPPEFPSIETVKDDIPPPPEGPPNTLEKEGDTTPPLGSGLEWEL